MIQFYLHFLTSIYKETDRDLKREHDFHPEDSVSLKVQIHRTCSPKIIR